MCGAISGFHALVSSGTTPKMVDRESDVRMIGYGAMLMEGLVGVVALIAAAALPNSMYYDINIDLAQRPEFLAKHPDFAQFLKASEADVHGEPPPPAQRRRPASWSRWSRTCRSRCTAGPAAPSPWRSAWPGSSPTRCPGMNWLIKYWYHFAIMFEALFILTTIDAGTRIARFLVQEFLGKFWKPLGDLNWPPAAILATGLVVFGWGYFIYTGSVETIWPMFGMANQLLAVIALAVVTTVAGQLGPRPVRPGHAPAHALRGDDHVDRRLLRDHRQVLADHPRQPARHPARPGPRLAQHRPDRPGRLVRAGDPCLGRLPMGVPDET